MSSYDEHLITQAGGDGESRAELQRKLSNTKSILAERERELLLSKGHCSHKSCTLHFAHSGPCR